MPGDGCQPEDRAQDGARLSAPMPTRDAGVLTTPPPITGAEPVLMVRADLMGFIREPSLKSTVLSEGFCSNAPQRGRQWLGRLPGLALSRFLACGGIAPTDSDPQPHRLRDSVGP